MTTCQTRGTILEAVTGQRWVHIDASEFDADGCPAPGLSLAVNVKFRGVCVERRKG